MKTLILVHHGDCSGEDLNHLGRGQMEGIAEKIRPLVSEGTTIILSSAAPWARQSAEVIADKLGIAVYDESEAFWSDKTHDQDSSRFMEEVSRYGETIDNIIVVSHTGYLERLPLLYTRSFSPRAPWRSRQKGTGVVIHFEKKRFQELEPWDY